MELITYEIARKESDKQPIVIIPLGDIQYTGQRGTTAVETLQRTIKKGNELGAYYLGLGDYCDAFSPSNRVRLKGAAMYDTAEEVIEDAAVELTQELYNLVLKPTKGRWLGMLSGHHFAELKTGETSDMRLCQMLDAKFLGTSAVIRLLFKFGPTRANVVLWAHHGAGSGVKAGSPLTKLENLAPYWGGIDVFLMGHSTKAPAVPINRIEPRWHGRGAPELVHKKVLLVSTGGFSRAYLTGAKQGNVPRGGYAEQRMLNPAVVGAPTIRILPRFHYPYLAPNRQTKTWDPEITVEV